MEKIFILMVVLSILGCEPKEPDIIDTSLETILDEYLEQIPDPLKYEPDTTSIPHNPQSS